jgi:hypothetical protein
LEVEKRELERSLKSSLGERVDLTRNRPTSEATTSSQSTNVKRAGDDNLPQNVNKK